MFRNYELVRSGNSTARVNYYFPSNNFVILTDIRGGINSGDTIVGDDSGFSLTLRSFSIADQYDIGTSNYFEPIYSNVVTLGVNGDDPDAAEFRQPGDQDDGELVVIDEYFTGEESEEYQTSKVVVVE